MTKQRKITCGQCGREVDTKLPFLILQVIEYLGNEIPIKILITWLSKCPYCTEMYDDEDSRYFEDTEELGAQDYNTLVASGVPVMKQVIEPEEDEEEDVERPSKIGFCSEETDDR